jgi:RNA polymerase sigma-70 factor (ECF subfamily)
MDVEEDRALVDRMVAGEQAAFDDFFYTYFDRLYRFALTRMSEDPHAAEDAVQQTMCRAMQKIKLYRGDAALFTWLCQICRNIIADSYRASHGRLRTASVPFEDNDEIRVALETLSSLSTSDPHESMLSEQVKRLVHVILDYLPTRYGQVLDLKYIQGLSVSEIAERMHVAPKAVESLLARARTAFREGFAVLGTSDVLDGFLGETQ